MPLLWSEDLLLTSFLFNCPTCPRILPGTHFIHLSIWLCWVLVAACRISGVQPELLAFRVGSLTGPPGEVPFLALIFDATFFPLQILFPNILRIVSGLPLLFTWFFFSCPNTRLRMIVTLYWVLFYNCGKNLLILLLFQNLLIIFV